MGLAKGNAPRIEQFLLDALPEDRPQLMEDLLRIEIELRVMDGDRPTHEEYIGRFPAEAELIDCAMRKLVIADVDTIGRFVGRFELLEEIGRGRQGVVYRAFEEGIVSLEVAVKLLGAGAVNTRDDAQRFINGVRCLARIQHDHIVDYRGSGDERGQLYYVMKYVRGRDLARFLQERGEPLDSFDAARG